MGEVLCQIEDVNIDLSKTEKAIEVWVGLLERAVLRLAETKDWTFRVESDVVSLRTVMTDWSAKVESHSKVRFEATGVSDSVPSLNF
jgi:hypothetical protein